MSISQEAAKNFGNLCCSWRTGRRHRTRKRTIGILLITIGLIWFGAKARLLDFSWLPMIYFWPAILILSGVWMIYRGSMPGITMNDKRKEE